MSLLPICALPSNFTAVLCPVFKTPQGDAGRGSPPRKDNAVIMTLTFKFQSFGHLAVTMVSLKLKELRQYFCGRRKKPAISKT